MNKKLSYAILVATSLTLGACDSSSEHKDKAGQEPEATVNSANPDILPYLNIKQQSADFALPFCENKNCIDIDIQSIQTQDNWLNSWIEKNQARVIQDQISLNQDMNLQQAINAYVKKSDAWQSEQKTNTAFELAMYTRMAYQRNQFILLQVGLDSKQEGAKVTERYYFFAADRKQKKALKILDIIDEKQQLKMDGFVQKAYQEWLKKQDSFVQEKAPQKLRWGQSDWFFDHEGIGLHLRTNEVVKDAQQLDIYLTKAQTQQVVKPVIYKNMF
ncbi:hypothetical protein [Acinetobacter portensis]|uniref:hypothetical protein n=1 Tax=Acinetobacter portensis TaxID=1839785 RepID=UPI0013D1B0DF|nr:hypothetical protein [Acinetobacter portensis]